MKLLEMDRVSVFYRTKEASFFEGVKEVSFSMGFHENLALVGRSGCGKSSLASVLLPPPARREKKVIGKVFYKGKELWTTPFPSSPIAFIFQDPLLALNPTRKMGHQLVESLLYSKQVARKEAKEKALDLLDNVALPHVKNVYNAYPHEMSRGMLQRVTIAMALAMKADLIVADEPTTALDITTAAQILCLLQQLQEKQGFSLLFISHQLSLIRKMCSKVLIMHEGQIVEDTTVDQLFSSPQHKETKKLLASFSYFSCLPPKGSP